MSEQDGLPIVAVRKKNWDDVHFCQWMNAAAEEPKLMWDRIPADIGL